MLNKTKSEIVIEMKHIDNANRLERALKLFGRTSDMGGDCELYIKSNGELIKMGFIGHDLTLKKVTHTKYP